MNKEKIAGLLPDYLLSIPVAVPLTMNLFYFFLIPQNQRCDFFATLLWVSAFLLMLYAVFYNKVTLKIFISILFIGAGIYFAVFYYIFRRMPLFSYAVLLRCLFQIVIFGVCVVVYFGSKYLWSVFILLAGGLGLFFYMSLNKMEPEPKTYYIYLAGGAALLAKKLICRRLEIKDFKEFVVIYGYSLCAAGIVLILANFIYTQTDFRVPKKTTAVEQAHITDYDDLDNMEHFGAPLALNDDIALNVSSSAGSFYLKADTFVDYSNSKWIKINKQSGLNLKNICNYMWMMSYTYEYDRDFFEKHSPSDIPAYINYFNKNKTLIPIVKMTVTHNESNFKCMFLPAGFLSFQTLGKFPQPVTEDYSVKTDVPARVPYVVSFPQPNLKSAKVQNIMKNDDSIVQAILKEWNVKSNYARNRKDGSYAVGINPYGNAAQSFEKYRSAVRAQYLKLSPSVTKRTKELAVSLTKGCTDDYEKIMAIKKYLQKNCTYTLTPPQPGNSEDIVDYFLFKSHIGYCAHYASAMTVMLRAAGVPARYVCGFVSPAEHFGDKFVITNEQAHAWVEVYSEALGFYTVDATENVGNSKAYTPNAGNKKHDTAAGTKNEISQSGKTGKNYKFIPLTAECGAVIAIVLLISVFSAVLVKRKKFKKIGLNAQAAVYYGRALFILRKFGFNRKPSETFYEFSGKLKWNRDLYKKFTQITDIYLNAAYGGTVLKKEDVEQVKSFQRDVLKHMRSYAGLPKYIAIRVFIALNIGTKKA